MSPEQGEVWDIDFGEGYIRPGIVVTRNQLNQGRLILVVPCTASDVERRSRHANNVLLRADTGGLSANSVAQVHLIQPVRRDYFISKRGKLDDEALGDVLQALAWAVDLYPT